MDIHHHYAEAGTGEPLILLHGNGESHLYFENQMGYFSKRYRVLAPDTRGHGRTARGQERFTLVRFARDLKVFMDTLGIEKAIILGFSDGGNIALYFTLMYPSSVKALVLNGANLFPGGLKPGVLLGVRLGYVFYRLLTPFHKNAAAKAELFCLMSHQPQIDPEVLERIKVPTLVMAGTRDMIRRRHTLLIHDSISNSRLALIRGDHFVAAKRPEAFNRAVAKFLKEIS